MAAHIWVAALAALAGLAGGGWFARLSRRRSAAQLVHLDVEGEKDVIATVLDKPAEYAMVGELTVGDFSVPEHQRVWKLIEDATKDVVMPAPGSGEAAFEEAGRDVPFDLAAQVGYVTVTGNVLDRVDLIRVGSSVYTAGHERNHFKGSDTFEPGGPGEPPLVRVYRAPSRMHTGIVSAALGLAGGAVVLATPGEGLAWWLGMLAVLALVWFSLSWALVDIDTLYVDFPSFALGTTLCWGLGVAGALVAGEPRRALNAALVAVGVLVLLGVVSWLFQLVRGVRGFGLGDMYIIVATAGVPALVFGRWELGEWGILASFAFGLIGWAGLRLLGKVTRETPFAFAPYLALSWIAVYAFAGVIL